MSSAVNEMAAQHRRQIAQTFAIRLGNIAPGLLLCLAVAGAAMALGWLEARLLGRMTLEPLVLAILLGAAVRLFWSPGVAWAPGVMLSAKTLLEVAVALLGAGISVQALGAAGPKLLAAIAGVVAAALLLGFGVARACGLRPRLALLVACGNAICGNSAIAAVAPVIGAGASEVASSIAFTALLGVVVVLALPAAAHVLALAPFRAGVLAGLTVYAVPQVLAAAAPMGALALQVGTLVKLVRVLALGPVVLGLSLLVGSRRGGGARRIRASRLVPWFILAFLGLAGMNSAGWVPQALRGAAGEAASLLTVVAMAGLGLQVDYSALRRVGVPAAAAATLSLLGLVALASVTIWALGLG